MRKPATFAILGLAAPILLVLAAFLLTAPNARADDQTVGVAIDVDPTGNGDNVIVPTEACNAKPFQVGDTFDVDVVVRGVPAYKAVNEPGGLRGFVLNVLFDPAVLQVNYIANFNGPSIFKVTSDSGSVSRVDYAGSQVDGYPDPPPGTSGNVVVEFANVGDVEPSGNGVLTRITMQAVGEGKSRLDAMQVGGVGVPLKVPNLFAADLTKYSVNLSNAIVNVGGAASCSAPTPTMFPLPGTLPSTGGTPSAGRSAWPAGLALAGGVIALGGAFALAIGRRESA